MLERRLEPEAMDTAEEARDYDSMDHSAVNRAFSADFLSIWTNQNPILDLGTGTAQIPIEICRQDARTMITAVDLAEEMIKVARANIARAGLVERITLERIDAKALPYPDGEFGAVVSNSIVHHIAEPAAVMAEMVRVCKVGGTIFVRDLMRPPGINTLQRIVDIYAAGANDHQRQLFAASLHAALTLDEVQTIVSHLGYSPNTVQATSDRHWTWAIVR